MSNFACTSCENCDGCTGSHSCTNCKECAGSTACRDCHNCSGCSSCSNCKDLTQCSNCQNCEGCMGCNECKDCTGCTGCTNCVNCQNLIGQHGWVDNKPPEVGVEQQSHQPFAWQESLFPGEMGTSSVSQQGGDVVAVDVGNTRILRQGNNTWLVQDGQEIHIGDMSIDDAVAHIQAGHELLQGPNGAFFDSGDGMVDIQNLEQQSRNSTGTNMGLEFPTYKISKEEIENDKFCVICQEDYAVADCVKMLPCLHKFHPSCIVGWLVQKRECPVCKWSVDRQGPVSPAQKEEVDAADLNDEATLPVEPNSAGSEGEVENDTVAQLETSVSS